MRADDVVQAIVEESEKHDLLLIGATGEGLFEQPLLGSIPERVAREAATTVTITKRYWRLKSVVVFMPWGSSKEENTSAAPVIASSSRGTRDLAKRSPASLASQPTPTGLFSRQADGWEARAEVGSKQR